MNYSFSLTPLIHDSSSICLSNFQLSVLHRDKRLLENVKRILLIATFSDNWNGNEAPKFPLVFLNYIIELLFSLEKQPNLVPTANDSIQLEYKHKGDSLEFEISFDKIVSMYHRASRAEMTIPATSINEKVRKFYGSVLPGIRRVSSSHSSTGNTFMVLGAGEVSSAACKDKKAYQ